MTTVGKKYNRSKATGSTGTTGSGELATGVTGLNYGDKGSLFIQLNPDKTAVIVQRNSTKTDAAGNRYELTTESLRQWGAWRAYFKKINRALHHFDKSDLYTVPAAWPHLFDAEATVAGDYEAANEFIAERARGAAGERVYDVKRAIQNPRLFGPSPYPTRYQPFPRLWEAFADNVMILNERSFQTLAEASKRLAKYGKHDAEEFLNARGREGWGVRGTAKAT